MTDQSNKPDDRRLYSPMPQVLKPAAPNQMKPAVPRPESELYRCPPEEFFRPKVKAEPPAGPGFYIVTKSIPARELYGLIFEAPPSASVCIKFGKLNPHIEHVIKAGSMMVLSDLPNKDFTHEESLLMAAAREVKTALDPLTPEEADFMYDNRTAIANYVLNEASTWLGVAAAMIENPLEGIQKTLRGIEEAYQNTYRQHGHLKSPDFLAERKRLLNQLDAQFLKSTRLRKFFSLGNHDKLKKSLGISSRSLVHHWDKAGGPGPIPGYATHLKEISRATQYIRAGGYIAISLGVASSILHIREVCSAGPDSQECRKAKFVEGGKLVGSIAGAAVGSFAVSTAAGPVCTALGAASGGIGGLACVVAAAGVAGAAAYGGGTLVSGAGEFIGEILYEATLNDYF